MTAKFDPTGWGFSDGQDNFGSETARGFWFENAEWLQAGVDTIQRYVNTGDGDSLILMDAALLGLAQRIRDHFAKAGVMITGQDKK